MAEPVLKWQVNEGVSLEQNAEPVATGKFAQDGENSTILVERHQYAYADRHNPCKYVIERGTRRRECKRPAQAGSRDEDGDGDQGEENDEGEEEEEEEDTGSDSDFTDDFRGLFKLGPTQPTLPKGHFELDRDHDLYRKEGREDEQLELIVGEPVDGVRAVSGFWKTKHGDSTLKGLITSEGLLFLYKAEDVVDEAANESASAGRRTKSNAAAKRRAKMMKPANMYHEAVPKDTFLTGPQHLSGKNSILHWKISNSLRELLANLVDQARVTLKEEFPFNTPPLEHRITRSGGCITHTFFADKIILAETTYRKKDARWTQSFERSSGKYKPSKVVGPCPTWVLTFKNFGAHIKGKSFLRGVSGAEKEGNPDVIGKFGDGLPTAIALLVFRQIGVQITTGGSTFTGVLDDLEAQTYIQREGNRQTERSVAVTLTFMPEQPELLWERRLQYTEHHGDPINPDTLDFTELCLPGSADRVSVNVDGPGTAPCAILLGENMRGKFYVRGHPVCDTLDCLFGYSLADPKNEMVQDRDRSAMYPKLTRRTLDKLLCGGVEISPRLRRKLVMELTRKGSFDDYEDIRPKRWTARAVEHLQQESRIMFEGTILLNEPTSLCTTIAEFRNLKPERCHSALDEGKALVNDFVEELRTLPREEIDGQDGAASGWASAVSGELLRLTGAKSVASVEFPGKLAAKHIVWVGKDMILISRRSLKTDLKKMDVETARFLHHIISCTIEQSCFERPHALLFDVYHLITNAEHGPEESPPAPVVNGASDAPNALSPGDEGAQGSAAGEGENAGPEVAPNGTLSAPTAAASTAAGQATPEATATTEESGPAGDGESAAPEVAPNGTLSAPTAAVSTAARQANPEATATAEESDPAGDGERAAPEVAGALSAPAAAAPAVAEEPAHPEVEENGPAGDRENVGPEVAPDAATSAPAAAATVAEDQANPEAMAKESGDESDGIDGGGMEAGEPQDSEERPLCGGKRGCDTGEAEAAAKRTKASESEVGGSASGATSLILAQVAPVAARGAGMPTVSVKVEESTSSGAGAFSSVKVEEPRSSEGAATAVVAPVQPGRSDEVMVVDGLGVGQEAGAGEVEPSPQPSPPPAPISAPERIGEELGAFLSEGDFVPALIHVERRAMGGEGGSVDLYRIAGRQDNKAELSARFSSVVASERVRRVLGSAVKQPGVDISLFCWDEPDALAAFVGQDAERIFVNLHHGSKSVDEWGMDDLPAQIASAMAHVRSATPANVHSHAWSVEFRKWVLSEEL